jgi:hypothetical protein
MSSIELRRGNAFDIKHYTTTTTTTTTLLVVSIGMMHPDDWGTSAGGFLAMAKQGDSGNYVRIVNAWRRMSEKLQALGFHRMLTKQKDKARYPVGDVQKYYFSTASLQGPLYETVDLVLQGRRHAAWLVHAPDFRTVQTKSHYDTAMKLLAQIYQLAKKEAVARSYDLVTAPVSAGAFSGGYKDAVLDVLVKELRAFPAKVYAYGQDEFDTLASKLNASSANDKQLINNVNVNVNIKPKPAAHTTITKPGESEDAREREREPKPVVQKKPSNTNGKARRRSQGPSKTSMTMTNVDVPDDAWTDTKYLAFLSDNIFEPEIMHDGEYLQNILSTESKNALMLFAFIVHSKANDIRKDAAKNEENSIYKWRFNEYVQTVVRPFVEYQLERFKLPAVDLLEEVDAAVL